MRTISTSSTAITRRNTKYETKPEVLLCTSGFQSVKEVSQICELFGIIGEKENRRGKKNGTVAAG